MATPTRTTTSLERPPQLARPAARDTHRYPPNNPSNPSPAAAAAAAAPATVAFSHSQPRDGIFVDLGGDDSAASDEKYVVAPADRELMRTPDPTPSEQFMLTHKARECNWARILDWRRYKNPRVFWPLAVTVTLVVILILFIAFKRPLVDKMRPFADWMYDTPGGWSIPIALLIAMSFPPLFGHEIVAILCGVVWGVWLGFAIVAAGTALGELANFCVYRWWCGARGRKLEESKLNWALLAEVVRRGGLKMPVLMRLTYIPSHFLTAVFATCGMNLWIFAASAVLSLPKQLAVVFIGVSGTNGEDLPTTTKAIKFSVIGATVLLTIVAMWYIYSRMDEVKTDVIYARRKRRQAKLLAAAGYPPELAYGADEQAGGDSEAALEFAGAGAVTQTSLEEVELGSQEVRPRVPRRPAPPPPPLRSLSTAATDPVAIRSGPPGAVWHYPKASIDEEGPRSPLVLHTKFNDVDVDLGARARGCRSMNADRKPGLALKGPRAPPAAAALSTAARAHD